MNKVNVNKKFKYSVDSVDIDNIKIIEKQMKHCICRIKNGDKIYNGFLCNIKYDKENKIRGLFTLYDIINDNDIKEKKSIELFFNNNKEYKLIKLDNNRKIYSDKNLGIRIFIIQNSDNINNDKNYLDLDDGLFDKNISYTNKSIYYIQNQKGNKTSVTFGNIREINDSKISHICRVGNNSEGSPILNLANNKVIGIQNIKDGLFLQNIIQDLINEKININNKEIENLFNKNSNIIQKIDSLNILGIKKYPNQTKNEFQKLDSFLIKNSSFKHIKAKNIIEKSIEIKLLNKKKIDNCFIKPSNKKKYIIPNTNNNINQVQINNNIQPGNVNQIPLNKNINNFNFGRPMPIDINLKMINDDDNNQNLNEGILINERYSNKLCKNSPKKVNVTFTFLKPKTFIVDYGITIHDILINYLKYMGMIYIFDYISLSFIYNASKLNLNDERLVENVSHTSDMRITVNISHLIVLKHFSFKSTSNIRLNLIFDNYSTIEELLKAFFEEVGKPELFGEDDKIKFLHNGEKIKYKDNKEIIEFFFKDDNPCILVIDTNHLLTGQ